LRQSSVQQSSSGPIIGVPRLKARRRGTAIKRESNCSAATCERLIAGRQARDRSSNALICLAASPWLPFPCDDMASSGKRWAFRPSFGSPACWHQFPIPDSRRKRRGSDFIRTVANSTRSPSRTESPIPARRTSEESGQLDLRRPGSAANQKLSTPVHRLWRTMSNPLQSDVRTGARPALR
jgi:hypothetical protein